MPYFMDFHIFDQVTVDEVKQAHVADKSIQNRYGVKYLQFWVNVDMGTVFCLMEGPDAKTCAQVHREAHGNVACNITEVQKGIYQQFMGQSNALDKGLVLKSNGKVDSGQRFLMIVDLVYRTDASHLGEIGKLTRTSNPDVIVGNAISEFSGKRIRNEWDDSILGVFHDEQCAVRCALEVKRLLQPVEASVLFKIGLGTGQPMSEHEGFFEKSLEEVRRLNVLAREGEMIVDLKFRSDSTLRRQLESDPYVRFLSNTQKHFVKSFFELVETHLNDSRFSVNFITSELCISRPQLYRRITEITGRSPNQFIRDIRLRRAMNLILENRYSVSEVAYEVGFGTPSYFTKKFQEKYGIAPSKVAG